MLDTSSLTDTLVWFENNFAQSAAYLFIVLITSLEAQIVLILMKSHLKIFFRLPLMFLSSPGHEDLFSSEKCIVLALTWRSMVNFEV